MTANTSRSAGRAPRIDLVTVGGQGGQSWPLGQLVVASADPASLAEAVERHLETESPEFLFHWGGAEPLPSEAEVLRLAARSGDVWHAGLSLGGGAFPRAINIVSPTRMLTRSAESGIESASWRVSVECCLVRVSVIRSLGYVDGRFDTLTGAGLDIGFRWLMNGALTRHTPLLGQARSRTEEPTPRDELRFVRNNFGRRWLAWTAVRMSRRPRLALALARPLRAVWREPTRDQARAYRSSVMQPEFDAMSVTVLIPTLDRYPYLEVVLDQLRRQTVPPSQVVLVDQTRAEERDLSITTRFADLPLEVLHQDQPGQSTARNAGLGVATGDAILFLDDDVEMEDDLIERHLRVLADDAVDGSCGNAVEVQGIAALPQPGAGQSTVFPTNNSMLRRESLHVSGLFDLAFDRGPRADHDLGMRLYLAGKHLLFDPTISVLHHRAPKGGLRQHGARVTTRGGSRSTLLERHELAATEVYLWRRYFNPEQVREAKALRMFGTLARKGARRSQVARLVVQLFLLPGTARQVHRASLEAERLLVDNPRIPTLDQAQADA